MVVVRPANTRAVVRRVLRGAELTAGSAAVTDTVTELVSVS